MGASEKNWHAIYVRPKSEKKVALELEAESITYYLPLIKTLKTWSDRKKWVDEPLFKGYIFVHVDSKEYYKAVYLPNAVKYISFEGMAVIIPPKQIHAIKFFLEEINPPTDNDRILKKGMKVEIIQGKLSGLTGELIQVNNAERVLIQIDVIGKSISIKIPKSKLRVID